MAPVGLSAFPPESHRLQALPQEVHSTRLPGSQRNFP